MRLLLIFVVVWLLGTCRSEPPDIPVDFEWTTVPSVASFVAEQDGRWLALKLRSEAELNVLNRRILASFTLRLAEAAD